MDTKNTQERILNLAHDLLNEVEQVVTNCQELKQEADEYKSLAEYKQHEIDEMVQDVSDIRKRFNKFMKDNPNAEIADTWHSVDDEQSPMDGEQVLVATANGTKYLQTYITRYGFTKEVAYWMSIPEIN